MSVKWNVTYKCRLCGIVWSDSGCNDDMNAMMIATSLIAGAQLHKGNPVSVLSSHSCEDGSHGIGEVIGIVKAPDDDDPK